MMTYPQVSRAVVVGAGPAGLATAIGLRMNGIEVRVLDQQDEGANTSRAAVMHPRTLEVLEPVGVVEELLRRATRVPRFEIRDGNRVLTRLDFAALPTKYAYTAMIPQCDTEAVLRERLQQLGVEIEWNCEATTAITEGNSAQVTWRTNGGRTTTVDADLVVGADGMHSRVRELAEIDFVGDAYANSFVLADVRMSWPVSRDTISLTFAADGLVVVAPLPQDRYRIVATAANAPERPTGLFLQQLLRARAGAGDVGEVVWSGRFRVHHRLATTYRRGRIVLVGDAAHVHSPAGGQGMNIGIQDGLALAELVAAGADLDEYERLRRPVAVDVVRMTDRLTRAATAASPASQHLRNAIARTIGAFPTVRYRMAMQLSELSYR